MMSETQSFACNNWVFFFTKNKKKMDHNLFRLELKLDLEFI